MLITDQYRDLNAQLHNPIRNMGAVGQNGLLWWLVGPSGEHDPANPDKDTPPEPVDMFT